jgi:hypothetical protein
MSHRGRRGSKECEKKSLVLFEWPQRLIDGFKTGGTKYRGQLEQEQTCKKQLQVKSQFVLETFFFV